MNAKQKVEREDSTSDAEVERGITARIVELKGSQSVSAFARRCKLPGTTVSKYLEGSMPGADKAVKIARTNGVRVEWLLTGKGPREVSECQEETGDYAVGVEFALIPRYDVEAAAGAGKAVTREAEVGRMAFRRDWLRQKGLSPKDLVMIRIAGDSMAPTIRDGSLALVDTREESRHRDGIYVLMIDGDLIAKRLEIDLAGGGVYIRSDNAAYGVQQLDAGELQRLFIVGRIVWAGGEV